MPVYSQSTTTPKRLWPLFKMWEDKQIGVHLVRLIVLYEDLRIEYHAFYAQDLGKLDQTAMVYRRIYFLRKIYGTLEEIRRAFVFLDRTREFREYMENQLGDEFSRWKDGVKFFQTQGKTITRRRNHFGGHVDEAAAKKVLRRLHPDTTGEIVQFVDPHERASRTHYKFAVELVVRFTILDRRSRQKPENWVKRSHDFLDKAMRSAKAGIDAINEVHVLPHFGIERRRKIDVRPFRKVR